MRPSSSTVQAPHTPTEHASFVPRQPEACAQQVDEQLAGRGIDLDGVAVHGQAHGYPVDPSGLSARLLRDS